jgi:hypothetical protein
MIVDVVVMEVGFNGGGSSSGSPLGRGQGVPEVVVESQDLVRHYT